MKRALSLMLGWLIVNGSVSWADGSQGTGQRVARGNFVRVPVYETPGTGLQSYYVDASLGNDSNSCQATGGSACLTIQGAINKIPKLLRDQVTVNVAAGSYAGFNISGFKVDNGVQQTTGGLLIDGALVTSTLATGSATGTATSGTAGSGSTFGTLTDSGATWTVNDLRGRFITTVSPTNSVFVISANTATTITVEGTWNSPTGSTTYTIQDPSVIIAGSANGAALPATPLAAINNNNSGVWIFGNNVSYRNNAIVLRNIRIASTNTGMQVGDQSAVLLTQSQIRPSAATASGVVKTSTNFPTTGVLAFLKVDISISSSNIGIANSGGLILVQNSLIRNATAKGYGILVGALNGSFGFMQGIQNSEILGFLVGLADNCGPLTGSQISGNVITCSASGTSRIGIQIGNVTPGIVQCPATISSITNFNISSCDTALQVTGPASADVTSMTGSAGTTGFEIDLGGLVSFAADGGVTLTAGTNQVSEDFGGATSTFAGITMGTCLATMGPSSRVCAR